MTPRANAAKMLASGRRNADRFHGELFAIYVMQENLTDGRSAGARAQCHAGARRSRRTSRRWKARIRSRRSSTTRAHTASPKSSSATTSAAAWRYRLGGTPLDRLIRDAEGIDVRVFPQ